MLWSKEYRKIRLELVILLLFTGESALVALCLFLTLFLPQLTGLQLVLLILCVVFALLFPLSIFSVFNIVSEINNPLLLHGRKALLARFFTVVGSASFSGFFLLFIVFYSSSVVFNTLIQTLLLLLLLLSLLFSVLGLVKSFQLINPT